MRNTLSVRKNTGMSVLMLMFVYLFVGYTTVVYTTFHWLDSEMAETTQVPSIDTRSPQSKFRKLPRFGRLCNRLVSIVAALDRAMEENFTVVLDSGFASVTTKIDMNLLNSYYQGRLQFASSLTHSERESMVDLSPAEFWCGVKTSESEGMRRYVRPTQATRQIAERTIAKIRAENPSGEIVSVHLRKYDGLCDKQLPNSCEWKSAYHFHPKPFGCNQTLTPEFWRWFQEDWPHQDWQNKHPVSLYLSTDRQDADVDASYTKGYTNHPSIFKVYEPEKHIIKAKATKNEYTPPSEMFVDMWVSTLADYFIGMPRSSCDMVVSQWRSAQRADLKEDRVHPRKCFGNYFQPIQPRKHRICAHTRYIALDMGKNKEIDVSTAQGCCSAILALGVAISKAIHQGLDGIHVYGEEGKFLMDHFELNHDYLFLQHFKKQYFDDPILFGRKHIYQSHKFRGSGVKGTNQVKCAQGQYLSHLHVIQLSKQKGKRGRHMVRFSPPSDKCFCFGQKTGCVQVASEQDEQPRDFIAQLESWLEDPSTLLQQPMLRQSPCGQVVALLAKDQPILKQDACLGGYLSAENQAEPSFLHGFSQKVSWACP